jgi:hypothetical protein
MKINLHHISIILLLAVLTPDGVLSSQAQDASYPIPESYDSGGEKDRDRSVYTAGDFDPLLNNKNQLIRDSVAYRPGLSRPSRVQAEESGNSGKSSSEEDDDAILSFNFLYYLVEKYKMQDIVD